jgi:CHAT domain-containing protein
MTHLWRQWLRSGLLFGLGLLVCLLAYGLSPLPLSLKVAAESAPLSSLVRQGVEHYQAGDFDQAIAHWQKALAQAKDARQQGVIYNNLAQAYRQVGQLDRAIEHWQQAARNYRALKQAGLQPLARVLVEQAQAYLELGQNRQAIALLCGETRSAPDCLSESALAIARKQSDAPGEALAWVGLADAYSSLGEYDRALALYQNGIQLATSLNDPDALTTAFNNLGNLHVQWAERYRFQARSAALEGEAREETRLKALESQNLAAARQAYEQSWHHSQAVGRLAQVTALINLNHFLEQFAAAREREQIAQNRSQVLTLLAPEPASRPKAYALINLAKSLQATSNGQDLLQSQDLLNQALNVAQAIGDRRAQSFALGSLGQLEEIRGQYDEAMQWTRQAQFAAQQVNAAESLYLWQWQAGRILNTRHDKAGAIRSYEAAIASLQRIRSDIITANRDLQFNFRDSVEPVYRELMALLLEREPGSGAAGQQEKLTLLPPAAYSKSQNSKLKAQNSPLPALSSSLPALSSPPSSIPPENLEKALDILERLKLAELQNYFGDECVELSQSQTGQNSVRTDPTVAVVYSVILKDHTEMILRAPGSHQLTSYPVPLTRAQMQQEIQLLRSLLEKRTTNEFIPQVQKIYNYLIRPLAADLAATEPRTLVFVNDGVLRNVPMSALHDGNQFLIEQYAIATAPSLKLTSGNPLNRHNLQALTAGLSIARPPFPGLDNVPDEAEGVRKILGGTKLLNQDFTLEKLATMLRSQNYPIVHMATHGKFGVDADSTFLLAYDNRIQIDQIDTLLRTRQRNNPVELLTLSACQTASGDERTALGIAGVAVRAGVASVIATLWYINDEATVQLIKTFYEQLRNPALSRAEALKNAQVAMIKDLDYSHPAVWSPFILVGNWL